MAPALLALLLGAQSNVEPREGNRLLPRKLRSLPVGILALHHPNPAYPVKEGGLYVWRHDTAVQTLVGDLTVVEFGSFIHTDAGWTLRVTMNRSEFAKAIRCPGGRLKKGAVYTNPSDWRRSEKPVPGDALWFYIAKDAKGRLYNGSALIETEGLRSSANGVMPP